MYCSNCGTKIDYESKFCINCGAELSQNASQNSEPSPLAQKPLGMGWFNFLIYFALFAGAVINTVNGVRYITGLLYGDSLQAHFVYRTFDGLKTVDVIMGILCIAVAVFGLFTRFQLAKFCKKGPTLLVLLYASIVVIDLFYIVGLLVVIPADSIREINFTNPVVSTLVPFVMIFINLAYFKKRKHLFVN